MKKKIMMVLVVTLIAISCTACHMTHKWIAANCISPKTCAECGETEGEALGHTWMEADCIAPKTCSRCGAEVGEALGHDWTEADCTKAKTCRRCGTTEGEPLEHNWIEADCTTPKTCSNCGTTEGDPLGHDVSSWYVKQHPTCTKEGVESGTCNRCKANVERKIEKKEHTPGGWQVTKQATSSSNGVRVRKCIVCGAPIDRETIKLSPQEKIQAYKNECGSYAYNSVARDPNSYKGVKAKISGRVIQVMEDGNDFTLRVAMGGSYDGVVLVTYTKGSNDSRILDNDWVTFYGTWNGTFTYESVMGASITVPFFVAKYM